MPDFSSILKSPSGTAKKPETLPTDDYPAVVKSFEFGDQNQNKTPYLRVHFGFIGPGMAAGGQEALVALNIDISKRQIRRDFYLRGKDQSDASATEACMYRLDQFLRSCGVEPGDGKTYDELIPQIVGAQVLLGVTQKMNENTSEFFNEVAKVVKTS